MIRSIDKDITAGAGLEVVETFITGKAGESRVVKTIWFEQTNDMILRGYRDQDRIVDVASECEAADHNGVPVDCPIGEGQVFQAGFLNESAGELTKHVVCFVDEPS